MRAGPFGTDDAALRRTLLAGLANEPHPGYAGAVARITRDGIAGATVAVGYASRYVDRAGHELPPDQRAAMTADTVFDIASLTKLFTAVAVLRLAELGTLDLDQPVAAHLPSYREDDDELGRARITPRHLLSHVSGHRSGLLPPQRRGGPASTRAEVLHSRQIAPLGRHFLYSCLNYITLGILCEQLTGSSFDSLIDELIVRPLGLCDTVYRPLDRIPLSRIAATEDDPEGVHGMLRGLVHDETARALGGVSGNAGLFSTVSDLAVFGEMLRCGGAVDGRRVLRAGTIDEMTREQLPPDLDPEHRPDYGQGLGPRLGHESFMGSLAADGAFGHTGFTGTSLVVDPRHDATIVLLTNGVHPDRSWAMLPPTRRAVAELATRDVADRATA